MTEDARGRRRGRGRDRRGPPPPVRDSVSAPPAQEGPPPAIDAPPQRSFEVDGQRWVVWVVGSGIYGAGLASPAPVTAVRFRRAEAAEASHEALIPRGRFDLMHDSELGELLERAAPLAAGDRDERRRKSS